ncbi:MAG: hypothetical protein PF904_15360 [Kiritimatiellae bacterium]|nr:hypothetical protein [Kiritimatiellia bacterium]
MPGACLFDGYDQADFQLQSTIIDNPSETTVVQFRRKGDTGNEVVVPVCDTNRRGFDWIIAHGALGGSGKEKLLNDCDSFCQKFDAPYICTDILVPVLSNNTGARERDILREEGCGTSGAIDEFNPDGRSRIRGCIHLQFSSTTRRWSP